MKTKHFAKLLALGFGLSLSLAACGELEGLVNGATPSASPSASSSSSSSSSSSTGSGSSTGSASTGTGSSSGSSGNNVFAEFLEAGDTYFGPLGADANVNSGLKGNAAAGSRFGGPDDVVGVLVVVRNSRGYMEVVNLENKRRYPVVHNTNGEDFSVPTDTLNSKPFPSLFVIKIASLTEFSFDHRVSPNPAKCNRYEAKFSGTAASGKYIATKQGETGSCRAPL